MSKPLTFNDIDQIAKSENMIPGATPSCPVGQHRDGETTYGSYTVVNHWPQKLSEQRTLYLDQFTRQTIANATADQDGAWTGSPAGGQHPHGRPVRRLHPDPRHRLLPGPADQHRHRHHDVVEATSHRNGGPAGAQQCGPAVEHPRGAVIAIGVIATTLAVLYPSFGVTLVIVLIAEAIVESRRKNRRP